jgi:uncharacterized membrane protein
MSSTDITPKTVKSYLAELKRALKDEPRAVIQDALTDAEEHLRMALSQSPSKPEAEIVAEVAATYGTPEETAEEYRKMEYASASPFADSDTVPETRDEPRRRGFFGVIADPYAYGALFYMVLSLATGIFYFTWVVTGISLSLGFFILIIGIPFTLVFLWSVRALAHIEGRIVEGLLGVRMPRRLPREAAANDTIWTRIKTMLADWRTWSAMLYFILKLPLGIVYFVLAVILVSAAAALLGAPIEQLVFGRDAINIAEWPQLNRFLDTTIGLLILLPLGALAVFLVLHLARGIGYLHGRLAELLLVRL